MPRRSFASRPRYTVGEVVSPGAGEETAGCLLTDGRIIDVVRNDSGRFRLVVSDGTTHAIADSFTCDGRTISPLVVDSNFNAAITWPTAPVDFGRTKDLFAAAQAAVVERGVSPEAAAALCCWAFSTWFADRLPYLPLLAFTAPESDVVLLFALLRCIVRRGLHLTELGSGAFLGAAERLQPTFLIDVRHLPCRQRRFLATFSAPAPYVPWNRTLVKVHFAAAIYLGPVSPDDMPVGVAIQIHIPSSRWNLPLFENGELEKSAAALQSQFLAYRLKHARTVGSTSDYGPPDADCGARLIGHALLSCFPDAPELQAQARKLLSDRDDRLSELRWTDPACMTIEALLAKCHSDSKKGVATQEVAKAVAALLKARGDDREIEPRFIGGVIRSLGLASKRRAAGYRLELTAQVCRRIHELARDRRVEAAREGLPGCRLCKEILGRSDGADNQGVDAAMPRGSNRL